MTIHPLTLLDIDRLVDEEAFNKYIQAPLLPGRSVGWEHICTLTKGVHIEASIKEAFTFRLVEEV